MAEAVELPTDALVTLHLLTSLEDREAGFERLNRAVGRDPGLVEEVLRYANSAEMGLGRGVESVREALLLLGVSRVRRWAVVEVMSRVPGPSGDALELGLARAHACELLGAHLTRPEREDYFLAGLLSVIDRLLGVPMADLLDCLPFSARVMPALAGTPGDTREVLARVLAEEKLVALDEPPADAGADTALRAGRRFALESRRSGVLL